MNRFCVTEVSFRLFELYYKVSVYNVCQPRVGHIYKNMCPVQFLLR